MNFQTLTDDQWSNLIESAPSEKDQQAAFKTMLTAYEAKCAGIVKNYAWDFKTFNDPELEQMFYLVRKFAFDFLLAPAKPSVIAPYWLTIAGKSEIGKSHLTARLGDFMAKYGEIRNYPKFSYNDLSRSVATHGFVKASRLANDAQVFNAQFKTGVSHLTALIIDDLNADVDFRVKRDLSNILMQRAGEGLEPWRWTVVTTNQTRQEISENYNKRVASRMRRSSNVILELSDNITPYLNR